MGGTIRAAASCAPASKHCHKSSRQVAAACKTPPRAPTRCRTVPIASLSALVGRPDAVQWIHPPLALSCSSSRTTSSANWQIRLAQSAGSTQDRSHILEEARSCEPQFPVQGVRSAVQHGISRELPMLPSLAHTGCDATCTDACAPADTVRGLTSITARLPSTQPSVETWCGADRREDVGRGGAGASGMHTAARMWG